MIKYANSEELAKIDQLAVKHGLEVRQMMELAGWNILPLLNRLKIANDNHIVVVCGKGNKGGDGLAAARHLINHGYRVDIVTLSGMLSSDAVHHFNFLEHMAVPSLSYPEQADDVEKLLNECDLIIDALIGYHLHGPPANLFAEVIPIINQSKTPVIAYDIPSGLEASTGKIHQPCIEARATLSLCMAKQAFKSDEAQKVCGDIFIADIGIPNNLYDRVIPDSRPAFEESPDFLVTV